MLKLEFTGTVAELTLLLASLPGTVTERLVFSVIATGRRRRLQASTVLAWSAYLDETVRTYRADYDKLPSRLWKLVP